MALPISNWSGMVAFDVVDGCPLPAEIARWTLVWPVREISNCARRFVGLDKLIGHYDNHDRQ
jgi:hypothetical protein